MVRVTVSVGSKCPSGFESAGSSTGGSTGGFGTQWWAKRGPGPLVLAVKSAASVQWAVASTAALVWKDLRPVRSALFPLSPCPATDERVAGGMSGSGWSWMGEGIKDRGMRLGEGGKTRRQGALGPRPTRCPPWCCCPGGLRNRDSVPCAAPVMAALERSQMSLRAVGRSVIESKSKAKRIRMAQIRARSVRQTAMGCTEMRLVCRRIK